MKDVVKAIAFGAVFLVPFITLYVANGMFFPYITGKNFAFRILVEIALVAWLILALLEPAYRLKKSFILGTFSVLLVIMAAATATAEHVGTALFSNFERMDGYITLLHVYGYFIVLAGLLRTERAWIAYLVTTTAVATMVALRGLSQLTGATVRVDSTLGNAAYMAIYMLFHFFFVVYLFVKVKVTPYRVMLALLGVLFLFILLQTGTRGTAIGVAVGTLTALGYLTLFSAKSPKVRQYALGGLAVIVVLLGSFYAVRESEYVQTTPALARIANIDLGRDLEIRSIIWGMSLEGIAERPILGWGQGNFNYVFNAEYDPRLYAQEQWFDRVHNIVFDWLIAGGIIGFVSYVTIFLACLYYLVYRPWRHNDETMTVLERSIWLGLLAGYVTHNLVVFDNIISYIFFAVTLAYLHNRYSGAFLAWKPLPTPIVTQIVAPILIVLLGVTYYFVHAPNINAAQNIITTLQTTDPAEQLAGFRELLDTPTFARQEIVEQLAQRTMAFASQPGSVPPEVLAEFTTLTEAELNRLVADKPNDARVHVFFAGYYRMTGNAQKAAEQLAIARSLSPQKQSIIIQQGAVALGAGDVAAATAFFKEAFELDTRNDEARELYLAALYFQNDRATASTLVSEATPEFRARIANSDFILGALNESGNFADLAALYEERLLAAEAATDAQNWASLAFVYYQLREAATSTADRARYTELAVNTLTRGAALVPTFASSAACYSRNITANRSPEIGCQ